MEQDISNLLFKPGTKVTICSDATFKHPRSIGFVKRIGVGGAWRLAKTAEWYTADGIRKSYEIPTKFARLYQEGDEEAILVEDQLVAAEQKKRGQIENFKRERLVLLKYIANEENFIGFYKAKILELEKSFALNQNQILVYQKNILDTLKKIDLIDKTLKSLE